MNDKIGAKINGAMALVAGVIVILGGLATAAQTIPMEVRHMGGGFMAAGFLMLIANAVIGILITGKK
jgi:hypothetical protein